MKTFPGLVAFLLAATTVMALGAHALVARVGSGPHVAHAASLASSGDVRVVRDVVHYAVAGHTDADLVEQVQRLGPREGARTWGAAAAWYFSWTYAYARTERTCAVLDPRVELRLVLTFPHWDAPADASPRLVDRWARYEQAAVVHEEGHGALAEQAAATLVSALRALPADASCAGLDRSADAVAQRVLDGHAARQEAYDRQTGHGAIQGAVFP